ncbi:MAG: hypothetical protein OSA97_05340 [Nevskia sp.]|nr:hypothetical protein [Nevskia sp.]
MPVGAKAGAAAFSSLIAIGSALVAAGLEKDPDASLRRASLELDLLATGAHEGYSSYCMGKLRELGALDMHNLSNSAQKELSLYSPQVPVTSGFLVSAVAWCPFARLSDHVADALKIVDEPSIVAPLIPHDDFLHALNQAYARAKGPPGADVPAPPLMSKQFQMLVSDLVDGDAVAHLTVAYHVDGVPGCINAGYIQEPDVSKLRLMVETFGLREYCFDPSESSGAKIVDTAEGIGGHPQRDFVTEIVQQDPRYLALKIASQHESATEEEQDWGLLKPPNGFEFPELNGLKDQIGEKPLGDVHNEYSRKAEDIGNQAEIFGVHMPVLLFLACSSGSLVLLTYVFLSALRHEKLKALPEVIADLTPALRWVATIGGIALLPALGWYVCAERFAYLDAHLPMVLKGAAAAWALVVGYALRLELCAINFEGTATPSRVSGPG